MQNNWSNSATMRVIYSRCKDERVQMAISSYIDGEADGTERALAEEHLNECRSCQHLVAEWSQDSARLRSSAQDAEIAAISEALMAQTRQWLRAELTARPLPRSQAAPVAAARRNISPRLAFGGLAAGFALFISCLGFGLATLAGPDSLPLTVGVTVGNSNTYVLASPANNLLAATPSLVRPGLGLNAYSQPLRFEPAHYGITPAPLPVSNSTPSANLSAVSPRG